MKKIGVLTSGGDAPGMNAAIRAVARAGIKKGMTVMGIYRGYQGLLDKDVKELHVRSVSDIIQRGGTMLLSARCDEFRYPQGVKKGVESCLELGIEGLIVIGGDGSFRGAADLSSTAANMGAKIQFVGIPGTIDNDIAMTEYTIGYDTAMNTAMEMIDKLRDTMQSHDRCSVVEVMGHHAGYIALNTGIACGATCVITMEAPHDVEYIVEKIKNTATNNKHHFIVVVSEGMGGVNDPTYAHKIAKEIEKKTGVATRATILGHVQRGGSPTIRDRVAASQLGHYAVELLDKGAENCVVGFKDNKLIHKNIKEALSAKKDFDSELIQVAIDIAF